MSDRWTLAVILTAGLAAGSQPPLSQNQAEAVPILVRDVTVVDITGGRLVTHRNVLIRGNRISAVGPASETKPPLQAKVVDGTGKFLIPGLWDMHAHPLRRNRVDTFLPLLVANGITGVRDPGSPLEDFDRLGDIRQKISDGTLTGPRIVASGPILDGPKTRLADLVLIITSPADAREKVAVLKRHGVDFVKVYNVLTREAYFALLDEARRHGLPVTGHLPWRVTAAEASDAGQKIIDHLGSVYAGVLLSCSAREDEIRKATLAALDRRDSDDMGMVALQRAHLAQMLDSFDGMKAAALFRRFKENGTWQVPTLVTLRSFAYGNDAAFSSDERLKYVSPPTRAAWKTQFSAEFFRGTTPEDIANIRRLYLKQVELTGVMHRAGVRIMAGSDAPPFPYVFPGFSLHDELVLLVRAGLTPVEALQTATLNPAIFLNLEDSLGTVERGKIADLVLLDADPLSDINNTRKIAAVIANGRYLPKSTLEKIKADVEAANK